MNPTRVDQHIAKAIENNLRNAYYTSVQGARGLTEEGREQEALDTSARGLQYCRLSNAVADGLLDRLAAAEASREANPERAKLIADARAMLDMLEANPNVPLPYGIRGQYSATGTDEEKRAEIDRVSAVLNIKPEGDAEDSHYSVTKWFGRNEYVAVAITKAHMDRYNEKSRLGAEAYDRLHGGVELDAAEVAR